MSDAKDLADHLRSMLECIANQGHVQPDDPVFVRLQEIMLRRIGQLEAEDAGVQDLIRFRPTSGPAPGSAN